MKYLFLLVLLSGGHCVLALEKEIIKFTYASKVVYSCTGNTCKVCISGEDRTNGTRDPSDHSNQTEAKTEFINQVCSKPFADRPTMKKAASFMNSFAGRMEKSGIKIPDEGFNFSQFVTSEKVKLCGSARKLIADMEAQLTSYREAAQSVQCSRPRSESETMPADASH